MSDLKPASGKLDTVELVQHVQNRLVARRGVLRGALGLAIGLPLSGTLLAACGGDDDTGETATTAPDTESEATATTGTAATAEPSSSDSGSETTETSGTEPTPAASSGDALLTPVEQLAAEQVIRLPNSEPVHMDPGVSYGGGELGIFANIFDGLVRVDQRNGEIVPQVAESFEANDDATEYTFALQQGLKWSDGTPMNANDFVWTWKRVLDPETRSQYIPALYPIKGAQEAAEGTGSIDDLGVEAVDDNTLKVTLTGPTPYFPLLATTWTFLPVPQHVIDEHGDTWVEAEHIVSNGPFMLTEWKHDDSMVLELNPNYSGEAPTITRAEYTLLADDVTQAFVAYENDELDFAEISGPDLDRARENTDITDQMVTLTNSQTQFVVCDTTNPPTDDYQVREALSMSIDRETLANQVLKEQVLPAPTILPPDIMGYNEAAALGYDPAKAKELLTAAGYDDPSQIEITLLYISTPADQKTTAEYLQSVWNDELGINVELSPIESNAYSDWRASRETQPFNTYIGSWGSDFRDPSNWHNQNFSHFSDHYRNHWNYPEFDELVIKAAVNINEDERAEQYQEAEAMLVEQAPIIPLYHRKSVYAVKPYVKNLFLQPLLTVVHLRTVQIEEH